MKKLLIILLIFVAISTKGQNVDYQPDTSSPTFTLISFSSAIMHSPYISVITSHSDSTKIGTIEIGRDTMEAIKNLLNLYIELSDRFYALQNVTQYIHLENFGESIMKGGKNYKYYLKDLKHYKKVESAYQQRQDSIFNSYKIDTK